MEHSEKLEIFSKGSKSNFEKFRDQCFLGVEEKINKLLDPKNIASEILEAKKLKDSSIDNRSKFL